MGKNTTKDTSHALPVESYRKQIGKQDYKKSKSELKEAKARAQAKKGISSFYKDVAVMIGALAAVIGVLYTALYYFLEKKEK
ncbi:triple QxxK/R motif-containing protein [Parasteatoda tepidariorum]|uniref:triple QxxK/R motif-containing protein n=1 Tax=Parasteatoda tepidariorum TaxID=114398 RepID=UPI001C71B6E4|nr:triple QxxK/R motif-containing protein [Parasteatoda tepidariorum]